MCLIAIMAVSIPLSFLQYFIESHYQNVIITNLVVLVIYLVLFFLWLIALKLIYDEPLIRLLLAEVLGGVLQHISYCLYSIINIATYLDAIFYLKFGQWVGNFLGIIIQFIISGALFTAYYFLFVRKLPLLPHSCDKSINLFLVLCLSRIVIPLLNALSNIFKSDDISTQIFVRATLMIVSVTILILYIKIIDERAAKSERDAIERLNFSEQEKYKKMKQNMELISIKCHDIKHFITAIGKQKQVDLSELSNAVKIYDSFPKTGNDIIDTMISEKSLYCSAHKIKLTITADASQLDFVSITDICALFGNLLDNAIEATEQVKDTNERIININIRPVASQVFICIENSFFHKLKMNGEEFLTTKNDVDNHGYGLKSIKLIVKKYDGTFSYSQTEHLFRISILFPIPSAIEK